MRRPNSHPQVPKFIPPVRENCIWLVLYSPEVIDKSRLVAHSARVHPNTASIFKSMKTQVVVRVPPIFTVYFSNVVNNMCLRWYLLCSEQPQLSGCRMLRARNATNNNNGRFPPCTLFHWARLHEFPCIHCHRSMVCGRTQVDYVLGPMGRR